MASAKNTKHELSMLESLRYAAHGINAPFACGGALVPKRPVSIHFPDKTQITVSRAKGTYEQEQLLQPLIARCRPAAFGKGRKTLYDRSIRDALQIKAENGAFSVLNFDPAKEGILERIRRELTPHVPNAPTAELYNLNIYATGGLSIAKSPNLQKTLDFPAGSQYSRRGNEWFNCLHLGVLLRLQSAS